MLEQLFKHFTSNEHTEIYRLQISKDFANTSVLIFFFLSLCPFIHTPSTFTHLCQLYVWVFTQWPLTPLAITKTFYLTFTPLYYLSRAKKKSFQAACSFSSQRENVVLTEFPSMYSAAYDWCTAAAQNTALPKHKRDAAPTRCLSVAFTIQPSLCVWISLFLFLGRNEFKEMSSILTNTGTH